MKRNKKIITVTAALGVILLLGLAFFLLRPDGSVRGKPTLTVETPQRISLSQQETFRLDVSISDLGDALYPAASFSICFDPARLEFLGVEEGNLLIPGSGEEAETLPTWSCNVTQCNETGRINLMYLDLTGGRYAFSREAMEEEEKVVFRLSFRLRGSAAAGDVYDLTVEDAVFAASDESKSLAMSTGSLRVKDGRVVVGE